MSNETTNLMQLPALMTQQELQDLWKSSDRRNWFSESSINQPAFLEEFEEPPVDQEDKVQLKDEEPNRDYSKMEDEADSSEDDEEPSQIFEDVSTPPATNFKKPEPQTQAKKIRMAKKKKSHREESDSEEEYTSKNKKSKGIKKKNQPGYPTKNFLQNNKGPHLDYLKSKLGQEGFQRIHLLPKMKNKTGMNLKDYEVLYGMKELKAIWEEFFRTKVLFRELMASRAVEETKKVSLRTLFVFEKAFKDGHFSKIHQ